MKLTFAVRSIGPEGFLNFTGFESTELSSCCFTNYDLFSPKRAIKGDLGPCYSVLNYSSSIAALHSSELKENVYFE